VTAHRHAPVTVRVQLPWSDLVKDYDQDVDSGGKDTGDGRGLTCGYFRRRHRGSKYAGDVFRSGGTTPGLNLRINGRIAASARFLLNPDANNLRYIVY
jgi:hypothetical protein